MGGWGRCFILSGVCVAALVAAAPGSACAAVEHVQCEHQLLARCPRVWAGQYQLLLLGAKGVAAAALGVHLLGVRVEAVKNSPQGAWVRAMALLGVAFLSSHPREGQTQPQGMASVADLPSCRGQLQVELRRAGAHSWTCRPPSGVCVGQGRL